MHLAQLLQDQVAALELGQIEQFANLFLAADENAASAEPGS